MLSLLFAALLFTTNALADPPTPGVLLSDVDRNMTFDTRAAELEMTVTRGRRVKTYEMESFGRGGDEAAIEFHGPARDKGTKMLKRGGELWMYMPTIEKTRKISGHMLRQGMMGSDLSYEDILQSTHLVDLYDATVLGEETVAGRPCWKLELTARGADIAYPRRISWVDKEHHIPVQEELFAVSGMMVKRWTLSEVKDFNGRKFPTRWTVEDQLRAGSTTVLVFEEMSFSVPLEDEIFSPRWLQR
ncbi:MAG: outer membrane lipoprotein-sorting protein [Myxococcota bacterium]